jgi:hypothetical protein
MRLWARVKYTSRVEIQVQVIVVKERKKNLLTSATSTSTYASSTAEQDTHTANNIPARILGKVASTSNRVWSLLHGVAMHLPI